jgi:hypothetical protein
MSAFMCPPEHFGLLAAFACSSRRLGQPLSCPMVIPQWQRSTLQETASAVARGLALENVRSLFARYRDAPGQYAEQVSEAEIWAAQYLGRPVESMSLPRILAHAKCYSYQSCESSDWEQTLAYAQIQRIIQACGDIERAPNVWVWTDPSRRVETDDVAAAVRKMAPHLRLV